MPCFACCDDGSRATGRRLGEGTPLWTDAGYKVDLAVSPLAGLKGAAGYHTSILIAGEEYFFSPVGIVHSPIISSHKKNPQMQIIPIGHSKYSGSELVEFLEQFFPPGHYDLLRKNCNDFSDCALFFLTGRRLEWSFRTLERIGKLADDHAGIIQTISGGEYAPNPYAVLFDIEAVINEISTERDNQLCAGLDSNIEFVETGIQETYASRETSFLPSASDRMPAVDFQARIHRDGDFWTAGVADPLGDCHRENISPVSSKSPAGSWSRSPQRYDARVKLASREELRRPPPLSPLRLRQTAC